MENDKTYPANEIVTGYHPDGFRIDKTAPAMDRYTKWKVNTDGEWSDPVPVCFHCLPKNGWYK